MKKTVTRNEYILELEKHNRHLGENNRKFYNQSQAMLSAIGKVIEMVSENRPTTREGYDQLFDKIIEELRLSIVRSLNYGKNYTIDDR